MIGKTISHYKILEKLGEGGMGVVYKAEDTKLKRTVALKFLPPDLSRDKEAKERFIHEAQAASALEHHNICNVHEIDETEDGQLFIAMDHYEGEALDKKIDRGPLRVEEALDIALQISEGLAKAHEKEIVHRDQKPANVMLTEDGVVKILDFGLAKLAGKTKLTKEGTTLGTVAYMSPEQTVGEEVDRRTDIFSLGVLVYETLTGQQPFKGDYEQAVMYSIMNEDSEPITALRTGVPIELERIVNKALAKSADERYQNLADLLVDLKRLRRESESSITAPMPESASKKTRQRRLKTIARPVGILLGIAILFLLLRPLLFEDALVSDPKPIAVISFENLTGDTTYSYLQKAIPNLLITGLEQSRYLQVTTWERMHDLLKQMGKENVEIVDKDLGFELCRMDGVDIIVLGSFTKAGKLFATDVKVLNVSTKAIVKSASTRGEGVASILEHQIDDLSKEISRGIGLSERNIETTQVPIREVTTTSMQAYDYYIGGREYYKKLYDFEAIRLLERAVALDSTFASAYFYLARIYGNRGLRQKFIQAYEKAMTYSKRAPERERLLIETYYSYSILGNLVKGDSVLQIMVQKYPKDKAGRLTLAGRFREKKQHHKAIEEYNQALKLDPKEGHVWNGLGFTYANIGDFAKALECLKQYAALSPGDANPFDSMAEVYVSMGDVDAAIRSFKEVQAIKPDFRNVDWRIGYAYALNEDYSEAMRRVDKDLAMDPRGLAGYHLMRGFYHHFQGRTRLALQDLQRADSTSNRRRSLTERLRGEIYYDLGDFDAGLIAVNNLVNLWTERTPARVPFYKQYHSFYLGLAKVELGQIDSAKVHFKAMEAVLPQGERERNQRPKFYYDLLHAEILLAEGSVEDALAVLRKMNPLEYPIGMSTFMTFSYNVPFRNDISARAYQKLRNSDDSIAEYERLTTVDQSNRDRRLIPARFHYRLAKLYEQKGLTDKAIARYEHFLTVWSNADPDWPELIDAKERLAKLRGASIN